MIGTDGALEPPEAVLRAFGADGPATRLPGGRGLAWRAGPIALKPSEGDETFHAWQADILARVPQHRVRVAMPRQSIDGRFVVDGWAATEFVEGEHHPGRWLDVIEAGDRFHASLAHTACPTFLAARRDRWWIADRAAWGDEPLAVYLDTPHVARLASLLRPVRARPQVIHGDLTGNVLFADPLPPAVIDFAAYCRPVGYARAIVVADALSWEGAEPEDLEVAFSAPEFGQLLTRALLFRIITDSLADAGAASVRGRYSSAVAVAARLVGEETTQ